MNKQTDRQASKKTYMYIQRERETGSDGWTDRDRQTDRQQKDIAIDRQIERQTDSWTDRQGDRDE